RIDVNGCVDTFDSEVAVAIVEVAALDRRAAARHPEFARAVHGGPVGRCRGPEPGLDDTDILVPRVADRPAARVRRAVAESEDVTLRERVIRPGRIGDPRHIEARRVSDI